MRRSRGRQDPSERERSPAATGRGRGLTPMSRRRGSTVILTGRNGFVSRDSRPSSGRGTGGASVWGRMSIRVAVLGTLSMGCVTQNIQFDLPEDFPPSVESSPRALHPIHEVVRVEDVEPTGDGGGSSQEIRLEVEVRDPNLDQRLQFKVFLDFNAADPLGARVIYEGSIPPSGALVRPVSVTLPRVVVASPGCHRLEMFVSGGFQPAPRNREPAFEGDLGSATWWVASGPSPVDMTRCP